MTDLRKAAGILLRELEVYFDDYPHMQRGYIVDALVDLREALDAPVVPEHQQVTPLVATAPQPKDTP